MLAMLPPVGAIVDVRRHGRATVLQHYDPAAPVPLSSDLNRVLVKYHDDSSTRWVAPEFVRRMHLASKRVLVAGMTEDYRNAIVFNVERQDTCLEIGSHVGVTTLILHKRCAHVVGLDTAAVIVATARQRYPHVRFEVQDGADVAAVLSFSPTGSYDKVCIDISGKAGLHLIAPLVRVWLTALPHATIIVKNEALFATLERYKHRVQHGLVSASDVAAATPPVSSPAPGCTDVAREPALADQAHVSGSAAAPSRPLYSAAQSAEHSQASSRAQSEAGGTDGVPSIAGWRPDHAAGTGGGSGAAGGSLDAGVEGGSRRSRRFARRKSISAAAQAEEDRDDSSSSALMQGLWEDCELFLHKYNGETTRSQFDAMATPNRAARKAERRLAALQTPERATVAAVQAPTA